MRDTVHKCSAEVYIEKWCQGRCSVVVATTRYQLVVYFVVVVGGAISELQRLDIVLTRGWAHQLRTGLYLGNLLFTR